MAYSELIQYTVKVGVEIDLTSSIPVLQSYTTHILQNFINTVTLDQLQQFTVKIDQTVVQNITL